jgi:hypothetical protein
MRHFVRSVAFLVEEVVPVKEMVFLAIQGIVRGRVHLSELGPSFY